MQADGVIRLDQLSVQDRFPVWVAICSEQSSANPFVLSPTVMQWSERILLCKVNDCEGFWLAQQERSACSLEQLFQNILAHHFGDRYIAVFANHPWPCLVYLAYQVSQQSQGIYFLQSRLNRNIFKSLEWEFWFAPQEDLISWLESTGAKRFKAEAFRARQAQFRRFIARIGLAGPFELKQADHQAITRRFDGWLGKVWRWTFDGFFDESSGESSGLSGFPWVALDQPVTPGVSRELEYPLNQWCHIEVLLAEDFARLCEQFEADDNEHINRMCWRITLFNDQVMDVDLSFRHPYSLHREAPAFKTALYQACYVYAALMQKLQRRDKDLDLPESMPFIGWKIEVCERIGLPPLLWDLFGNDEAEMDTQALRELQNKLSIPIESYCAETSFYPEQSFRAIAVGAVTENACDDYQWSACSSYRPLFYDPQASEIEAPDPDRCVFLERCASQWWLHETSEQQVRDYFLCKDRRGRASWVYRSFDGRWYRHGEYC